MFRAITRKIALTCLVICCNVAALWLTYFLVSRRQSRPAVMAAAPSINEPAVGSEASDFVLPEVDGKTVALSSLRGRPLILGFFCGCDRCHAAARRIAEWQRHGKLKDFVAVIALDRREARQFQHDTGLHSILLTDPSDQTAISYDSDNCPRLWQVSATGEILQRSDPALQGRMLDDTLARLATRQ